MAMAGFKMDMGQLAGRRSSLETKKSKAETNAIQGEVFVKWVNMKLKDGNPNATPLDVAALTTAFRDGLVLSDLLHVVCDKKPGKIKKEVKGKIQEIGNLNVLFTALNREGVKLVNIGPEDIWDGDEKLMLGFLWTLIYNFQVLKGSNFGKFDAKALGAKVALLKWIQSKIPEMMITNLTDDWRDGRALSALANAIAADFKLGEQIKNAADLPTGHAESIANLENAMAVAEEKLSIGRLVTANQVAGGADEKSMMTYLSLFASAKKPKAKKVKVAKKEPAPAPAPVVFFEAPVDPELLKKINALFDVMDGDGNGSLTKYECLDFLKECKPKDMSVSKVQRLLGLEKHLEIDRKTFIAVFVDGKLDVDAFDTSGYTTRVYDSEKAAEAKAAEAAAPPPPSTELPPPTERAADWRVYEGPDLGGRCKIKVYFSTTTSSQKIRGDTNSMKALMERHGYHKRPDFEHFTPVDIDMTKDLRDKIFAKAGTRITPMLFVDDEFVGGYERVAELSESGELERIMDY